MTDKIKEILEEVKFELKFEKWIEPLGFDKEHWKLLLDYITNLQEENKNLKQCYCNRTDCGGRIKDSKKYDSVQQRLDKIIAHLGNCDWNNKDFEKIYDIATGSDEE